MWADWNIKLHKLDYSEICKTKEMRKRVFTFRVA